MYTTEKKKISTSSEIEIPDGKCLVRFTYSTCKSKTTLALVAAPRPINIVDGCIEDAWWTITSPHLPPRYVRLIQGIRSVRHLANHYGIMDANMCLNTQEGILYFVVATAVQGMLVDEHPNALPRHVRDKVGIPQRLINSGNCWYSSVCFALFFNRHVRKYMLSKIPTDLHATAKRLLYNFDAAESMRRALWERYAFGDPIDQAPELDGQNGMSQIFILASKLDIPMRRMLMTDTYDAELREPIKDQRGTMHSLRAEPTSDSESHFFVVRFRQGKHSTLERHRPTPFMQHGGRKYRLMSFMLGSEHCGHQIAAASPGSSMRRWAVSDSDARRYGICPLHWQTEQSRKKRVKDPTLATDRWWSLFRYMIPSIYFHNGLCDMSPHNRPIDELTSMVENQKHLKVASTVPTGRRGRDAGLLNVDLVYFSKGT